MKKGTGLPGLLWLVLVCGWHHFSRFYPSHPVIHWSHGWYTCAHTYRKACLPSLYLHSPLSQPVSHTYIAYTHTWCFIFVSIFWFLQLPAGLWTLVSFCMANPWGVPAFVTHTQVACETHWQSHTMLTSVHLFANSTSCRINALVPRKNCFHLHWWGGGTVAHCPAVD